MPELPEVETIKRGLMKYLIGLTIDDIHVRLAKMVRGDISSLIGEKIVGVRRFGKGLIIDVTHEKSLAVHVKMTGQLIYQGKVFPPQNIHITDGKTATLPNTWTHVIFTLSNPEGGETVFLYYNDIRQFGWLHAGKTEDIEQLPFFQSIGPEPLKDLTLERFKKIVHKPTKLLIKQLLMDQHRIAGVGNIYANDALFLSHIHPLRLTHTLTDEDINALFVALETVLKKGISAGGASSENYVNALGEKGRYQNFFQVYGRQGKPCLVCGRPIERIKFAGRSAFFCPTCQK